MHRITIVVLTLIYAPVYYVIYIVTAFANLGGGGVSMDGIVTVSYASAVIGLLAMCVCLAVAKEPPRMVAAPIWGLWLGGAIVSPLAAVLVWRTIPGILWAPPVVVLILCWVAWKKLSVASPGVAPSLEQ